MKKIAATALFLAFTQSACIVAGYSSRGGWFVWPSGLVIVLLVLFFLLRR